MTTRRMWDGINTDARYIARRIQSGDLVAYYIDGWYAWTESEIALFEGHEHVTITVLGNDADVADCETGDLTPAEAAAWIRRQKSRGYDRPTVYRSRAVMQDIRNSTGNLIMGKDWDSWVADYDNSPVPDYAGEAAKQYRSETFDDISAVYDGAWPHRAVVPPPVVTPRSYTSRWPAGRVLQFGDIGNAVLALQKGLNNVDVHGVRNLVEDGKFGLQTRTGVRNFEGVAHLTPDAGVAGSQVRTALIHMGMLSANGAAA